MTLVSKEKPYTFTMDSGKTVAITGTNYHINMDKPAHIDDYIIDKKLGDYHIHIVHGMLSDKGFGPMIRHTTIDQIKHTKADITFCGHDHIGFDTVEYDNKYFINPGAVVRLKNDVKEMSRTVKVVIVDISDEGIKLTEVPLETALDGNKVLSREVVERKKEKQFATEAMKSQIKQLEITQKMRFDEILEEIYVDKEIDKSVIEDLSKRINEKQVAISPSTIAPKDSWITEIEITNFHSHKSTKIDFSKNLNVIIGESRQGKTSILRAIRWVLENKPTGRSMIRHGEDYCSVKIKLANGTIIMREIGHKINGYKIIMPNGEVQEGNTKLVGTVQALCGFNNMVIDSKLSIPINFMRQGTGWYLIGDNVTATDRARILGAIQNTNSADAVVKDLDRENLQYSTIIKNNNKQIDATLEEIHKVSEEKEIFEKIKAIVEKKLLVENIKKYLELKKDYEEKCRVVSLFESNFKEVNIINYINRINKLTDTITEVETSINVYNTESKKIKEIDERLKLLSSIPEIEDKILKVKEKAIMYDSICENAMIARKEYKRQQTIALMMDKLSKVKDSSNVEKVKKLIEKKEEILKDMAICKKSTYVIQEANKLISNSDIVDRYDSLKNDVIEKSSKIENITQYYKEHVVSQQQVKKREEEIEKKTNELNSLIEKKAELLKEAKICPTCMGDIDENITKNLFDKEEY
jgi:exonuclease SbcC